MRYSKIEFGVATTLFLLFTYFAVNQGFGSYGATRVRFALPSMAIAVATYAGFLTLNYYVVPKFWLTKKYTIGLILALAVFLIVGSIFTIAQSYLRDWYYVVYHNGWETNMALFSRGFSMASIFLIVYGGYVFAREIVLYQYELARVRQNLASRFTRELIITCSIWLIILLPLFIFNETQFFKIFGIPYIFVGPYCIALYFINLYWLIPLYIKKSVPGLATYLLCLLATAMVLGIVEISLMLQGKQWSLLGYLIFYWLAPTVITAGLSWWVYWFNAEAYKQLAILKTALGNTSANLQYLRAQINPHFLFNALNTLYGTALMEKAEKTGEGIQKLGDMMRFMLHENNLDRIALGRELEYLNNYIDLQNMRLALSPNLVVEIHIEEIIGYDEIAPMLLIPFIENAFKHGISLKEKSWIKVNLYKREAVLHLDVHNSIHPENVHDPEKNNSGIGLENVKQRLQLLYPGQHELVIRQNPAEFFIHLSLTLTQPQTVK